MMNNDRLNDLVKSWNMYLDQKEAILVNGQLTKEIIGKTETTYGNAFLTESEIYSIVAPKLNDEIERNNLIIEIDKFKDLISKDPYSRQFNIQPKYIDNNELSACISNIQFLYRPCSYGSISKQKEKKHELLVNVYFRSQNINNYVYDNATLQILARHFEYLLEMSFHIVDYTIINQTTGSFHKILF